MHACQYTHVCLSCRLRLRLAATEYFKAALCAFASTLQMLERQAEKGAFLQTFFLEGGFELGGEAIYGLPNLLSWVLAHPANELLPASQHRRPKGEEEKRRQNANNDSPPLSSFR